MTIQTNVLLYCKFKTRFICTLWKLSTASELNIKMEEIRLEEKRVQDDQTERKETIREKFIRFFDVMTIEPMMFLQGLGWCMTSISQTQMLLYKTCRGKIGQADDLYIYQSNKYQSLL